MPWSHLSVPFGSEPVEEVLLAEPPLVSVVAQMRFPTIVSIARQDFIGEFQELIRTEYPVLQAEQELNLVFTPAGIASGGEPSPVWRFSSKDGSWQVSLASSFIALSTTSYLDQSDFVARFSRVLMALSSTVAPALYDRLGLRYVDRVVLDHDVTELDALVRDEVRGMATTELGSAERLHSLTDAMFRLEDSTLHGRWGLIPPGQAVDPFHGPPVPAPAWILDLDMYREQTREFVVAEVAASTKQFADQIYRFFRWAVTPELLRRFGGVE